MDRSIFDSSIKEKIGGSLERDGDTKESNYSKSQRTSDKDSGLQTTNSSSKLKIKRCKHGRIIVKDLTKQKKRSQTEASPRESLSARIPATPPSNNSASSDIYDPGAPITPISPGDSPPISPADSITYSDLNSHSHAHNHKTEDDVPSSAVQLNQQEKYLQKLNRQERVVEEVKLALKPHYSRRSIDKEQYKDVLRRAVPKVRIFGQPSRLIIDLTHTNNQKTLILSPADMSF